MNKNTLIIVVIVTLLVIAGGIFVVTQDKKENMIAEVKVVNGVGQKVTAGSYESYSADKIARAENGDVVLFFHASWCPSCRGLNANIENNLGSIPENLIILKTDYDKETELKKKYGVTYQHTLVQVDKDGSLIKKWSGGGTLETILAQLK